MWTLIVGAGSKESGGGSLVVAIKTTRAPGRAGMGGFCGGSEGSEGGRRPRHTLAKWSIFLQWWHVML